MHRRGYRGHGDVGGQRAEPDAVGQADRHRRRGRLHQDKDGLRGAAQVDEEAAMVPVLRSLSFQYSTEKKVLKNTN